MNAIRQYIRSENEKTKQWLHAHPIKACVFVGWFTIISTVGIMWPEDKPCDCLWWLVGAMAVSLVVGSWIYLGDIKRLTATTIVAALALVPVARAEQPPEPPVEEHPALVVVVVGGIGVAGWLWWKMHKCSEKAAKGRTNNWPAELVAQPEWGAAFSWTEGGSCYQDLITKTPTVFTIDIEVKSASNSTMTVTADVGEQFTESFDEAIARFERSGLAIATEPGTHESYEINGQPAFHDQVPLSFNFETKTATVAPGGILVTVDRSTDLRRWEPAAKFNVPQGQHLTIPDVSEARATFWRVTTNELHD